ncbi:MAG: efflux RND transporter permease subunit [Treponema sp.]|jgi:HAE1 family hydrophobic/amphiphilic exporter-1|nr:efflux RND transporter permease subunit [Treponema sp.]
MKGPVKASPAFFIFIIITILSAFAFWNGKGFNAEPESHFVYRIRFEYFGMDAGEMEKLIAAPLEEGISALGNVAEIRTVCDYGLTETTVFFNRNSRRGLGGQGTEKKKVYLALRDTVDSLYRDLPQAVQKPRIYESGGRRPFLSAAILADEGESLNHLRTYLEHNLKGELENLEGVGEVVVSGGSVSEVHIKFDPDRGAETGLNPAALGGMVQDANVLSPGAIRYGEETNEQIQFKTRIGDLEEIKELPVKAGEEISALRYFADIGLGPREQREIFTLDGRECAGISITAVPGANLMTLSRRCRELLETTTCQILRDEGEVQREMIRGMAAALIQSFAAVIIIIPFFFSSLRAVLLIILFLPVCVIWSLGFLRIINMGIDQYVLSGLSISLGLAIDPWLVIASSAERVKELSRGIAASAFTTLLVIFPLCFLDSITPGIQRSALAVMAMVANSLVLGLFFFAPFLGPPRGETAKKTGPAKKAGGLPRRVCRAAAALGYLASSFALGRRRIAVTIYAVLGLSAFVLFFYSGKNLNLQFRLPLLYVSAEFESSKSAAAVHRDLEDLGRAIRKEQGVRFVGLECRNGAGEFEIGFDGTVTGRGDLADRILSLSPLLGDGFLYVPDAEAGFKSGLYEIEVTAVSAEGERSRELAREGAEIAGKLGGTVQTVLNFKDPAAVIAFTPDREVLAKSGLTVRDLASSLRWLLFGPVTGKWLQGDREIDIRVMGRGLAGGSRSSLANLALPSSSGPIRLETLGALEELPGEGAIYRRDGRRVSYFTVHLAAGSASAAAETLRENLNRNRERGSGFLLPRELETLDRRYAIIFLVFMGSFAGIFLVLLGMTEKLKTALRICSIIPVSCALPLLVKFLCRSPLEIGDAVALVAIAGLSVNNGVFLEESRFSAPRFKIRDKIIPILVTSLTGITGAVPLALLGGEGLSASLSRSILWGIAGSLLASLFLFPALYPRRAGTGPALPPPGPKDYD